MGVARYHESMADACADFWWSIYQDMPYVHRPDGYQSMNSLPVGPDYFTKHLQDGLNGEHTGHWCGEVTPESILVAEDGGHVEGILVGSTDQERGSANILSAYMRRNARGRGIAAVILSEALAIFERVGLSRVVAAPDGSKSMEVECPLHLALLEAGFSSQEEPDEYGVFLGGSLEGFMLSPEVHARLDELGKRGITFERHARGEALELRRLDTGEVVPRDAGAHAQFVALVDGLAVGWTFDVITWEDEGRTMGAAGPFVIPSYRGKGIGKALQHLGTDEVVRRGATAGWQGTTINNPARFVYHSIGWSYWYTSYGRLARYRR